MRPSLIDLNLDELHCYSFMVNLDIFDISFNTVENPFGKIYVLNKIKDLNLKLFIITTGKISKDLCSYYNYISKKIFLKNRVFFIYLVHH